LQKRVEGGPLQIALLDEIAERLLAIQKYLEESRPEGITEPIEPVLVTDEYRVVRALKPWFSVIIINDGPDDVFVIVNSDRSYDPHRVPVNEVYNIDMKRGIIRDVVLWCEKDKKASVRIVGVR